MKKRAQGNSRRKAQRNSRREQNSSSAPELYGESYKTRHERRIDHALDRMIADGTVEKVGNAFRLTTKGQREKPDPASSVWNKAVQSTDGEEIEPLTRDISHALRAHVDRRFKEIGPSPLLLTEQLMALACVVDLIFRDAEVNYFAEAVNYFHDCLLIARETKISSRKTTGQSTVAPDH